MLLTMTTTRSPATDLGFVLHKHPERVQSVDLTWGQAHVFWPEATPERATCALLVDIDPVRLVRGKPASNTSGPLGLYVNDRPYVASSFTSAALSKVFGSALNGHCAQRPELVEAVWPLEIRLDVVASRGGPGLLTRLFEPLGYRVEAERLPRDEAHPEWGDSALYRLVLHTTRPVMAVLRHLYVLLPVLDHDKHYWVGPAEVDKLLAKGEGWLAEHPDRELIAKRYLKRAAGLARRALSALEGSTEARDEQGERQEQALEKPLRLNDVRMAAVAERLRTLGVESVADVGCGEGRLLRELLKHPGFQRVVGVDVSATALEMAQRRTIRPRSPVNWAERLTLLNGSALYRDPRLDDVEAVALVEVIEHIDQDRLPALEQALFGGARPAFVVVTTPNAEYNVLFEHMRGLRHSDHRFEWTRAEFRAWAERVAETHGYSVSYQPIGPLHETHGPPTQMAVFHSGRPGCA